MGRKILQDVSKNEMQANVIAAKVMRITFLIFSLVFILNIMGIFTIDAKIMTLCYLAGSFILWLPTIMTKFGNTGAACMKYIIVANASVFVLLTAATLTYHATLLYVYGIAIASLYFSKKLNIFATVLAVLAASCGKLLAFYFETTKDSNFTTLYKTLVFSVVPKVE